MNAVLLHYITHTGARLTQAKLIKASDDVIQLDSSRMPGRNFGDSDPMADQLKKVNLRK